MVSSMVCDEQKGWLAQWFVIKGMVTLVQWFVINKRDGYIRAMVCDK